MGKSVENSSSGLLLGLMLRRRWEHLFSRSTACAFEVLVGWLVGLGFVCFGICGLFTYF